MAGINILSKENLKKLRSGEDTGSQSSDFAARQALENKITPRPRRPVPESSIVEKARKKAIW